MIPQPVLVKVPGIKQLQNFLESGLEEVVRKKIEEFKLPYDIIGGKVVDVSDLTEYFLMKFVTVDPKMLLMKEDVRKLALVNDEVLISGESGTGKEIIARALHSNREGKYIAVNCAGIPENLLESTLFGYVKGSFTGADLRGSEGLARAATNGTLFLDEVGELQMDMQAKLLRMIQEKKVSPVGSHESKDINCRTASSSG